VPARSALFKLSFNVNANIPTARRRTIIGREVFDLPTPSALRMYNISWTAPFSKCFPSEPLWDILSDMKTVAVREICKQWSQVLEEHAGSEVPITSHGEVVAYLRVLPRKKGQKVQMPDFKARIKARFGKRVLKPEDVQWLDEAMRSRY
jgi:antitoxin (DNA-binding transcriptional repressor) of toxin-antitoxin stability system